MTRQEIKAKIRETELAISKTDSWKCRRDLQKYIYRLRKELKKAEA